MFPPAEKYFLGSSRNLGGAAWGRVCGRAKILAGTLRCLRLLLDAFDMLIARGTVGALPQTPAGTLSLDPARGRRKGTKSPLDPFSRLSWSHFHAPSACSFLVLRLSPCLLPQHSVKNQITSASPQILPATARQSSGTCTSDAQHRGKPGHCPAAVDPASLGRARSTSACAD